MVAPAPNCVEGGGKWPESGLPHVVAPEPNCKEGRGKCTVGKQCKTTSVEYLDNAQAVAFHLATVSRIRPQKVEQIDLLL